MIVSHSSQVSSAASAALSQPSPSLSSRSGQSTQSSSLVINLERPGDLLDSRGNSLDSRASRSSEDSTVGRHATSERPPPLPSRGGGVPRRSRRRDHSIPRKVDVVGQQQHDDSQSVTSSSQGNPSSPRLSISSTLSAAASSTGSLRRHSNPSAVLHKVENSDSHIMDSLSINTNFGNSINSSSQHTEFYNLSSPNMKVRVSKSPVVSRNPNKVGRAEYLMSLSQSGVKSPTSPSLSTHSSILGDQSEQTWAQSASRPITEDDHQDARDYLDAVARASQQKYGFQPSQQGSLDRHWGKMNRQVSNSDQSSTSGTDSPSAGGGNSRKIGGYVNLPNTSPSPGAGSALSPPKEIIHSRQRSAPEAMLDVRSLGNTSFVSQSSTEDQSLVPPPLAPKHSRQPSADESGRPGFLDLDPSVQVRPKSAGGKRDGATRSGDSSLGSPGEGRSPAEEAARRQLKGFSSPEETVGGSVGSSVAEWMVSASCEDLSDHMRTVIYDHSDSEFQDQGNTYAEIDSDLATDEKNQVSSSVGSNTSNKTSEKPPLPFTGLKKFQNNTDYSRDRSKSFGYINIPNSPPSNNIAGGGNPKPQSTAPSAHLIRKMVNARSKQETLRKSLSNPNFLNLGSKEHLFTHKSSGVPGGNGRLAPVQKQKSRSFGSLFFPAIRKALSRESLGGRGRSVTPERRSSNSRSTTPEGRRSRSFSFRRRNSEGNGRGSSLRRRDSFHGPGEMTIKGIRMTARSRSFRRARGAKSVEVLTNSDNNLDRDEHAVTTTTTTSDSSGVGTGSKASTSESNQRKISSPPISSRLSSNATVAASMSSPMSESEAPGSAVSTLVYTTLSFAHLPPVPHPDIPPPVPARRKSEPETHPPELPARESKTSSNHNSSNYMNLRSNSKKTSHNKSKEVFTPPEHDSAGNEDSEGFTSRKPRVSDIVAKIEDTTNNNNNNPVVNNSQEGRKNMVNSQVYNNDSVTLRGASSKFNHGSQRGSAQDHHKPPVRPSSRTKSGGYLKSEMNSPREPSETNSINRSNQLGQVRSRGSQKNTRSDVFPHSSSHKPLQSQSSTEGADSQPRSAGTPSNKVITPFQPIPFKRQTNGISSVKPPSRSSFSSS